MNINRWFVGNCTECNTNSQVSFAVFASEPCADGLFIFVPEFHGHQMLPVVYKVSQSPMKNTELYNQKENESEGLVFFQIF